MPWTTFHAWNTFVKLEKVFMDNKKRTACMMLLTLISSKMDGDGEKDIFNELNIYKIINDTKFDEFDVPDGIVEFLTILFNTTNADQIYLDGLRSIAEKLSSENLLNLIVDKMLIYILSIKLSKAKQAMISYAQAITVKIVDFSIEHKEESIATDAVNLMAHINNIENFVKANRKIKKNQIEFCVFELDGLIQKLYVFYKIHPNNAVAEKMGDNNKGTD